MSTTVYNYKLLVCNYGNARHGTHQWNSKRGNPDRGSSLYKPHPHPQHPSINLLGVPIEMGSLFMKPRRHYLRFISGHHFEIKKLRINLGSSSHNPDFEGIERSRLIKRMILI